MDVPKVIPPEEDDASLIRRGAAACGTQKALAAVCGCSERMISNVMQGKRALPRDPLPIIGKTPRALILEAIAAGGNVPKIHRGPGAPPRVTTDRLRILVTAEEKAAIDAVAPDVSDAVLTWIATWPERAHRAGKAARSMRTFPAVPADATITIHRVLTPRAHEALRVYLDGEMGLRDRCVRAALRVALGFAVDLGEG